MASGLDYDTLARSTIIHGSPATVVARIAELKEKTGFTSLMLHYPPLVCERSARKGSLELFAREVVPRAAPLPRLLSELHSPTQTSVPRRAGFWTRSFRGGRPSWKWPTITSEGLKTITARACASPGRQSFRIYYLRRLRNNPSTPHTSTTNAEDLKKDAWRRHFDGAVCRAQAGMLGIPRSSAGRAPSRPRAVTGMSFGRCAIWRAAREPTENARTVACTPPCRRYKCTA